MKAAEYRCYMTDLLEHLKNSEAAHREEKRS
jgi:hypothetical protein